jgi:hypothetical protein
MVDKSSAEAQQKPICGIIMPISALDGCTTSHWSDVFDIFSGAIEKAGFEPNIVSNAEEVTFIHKTIIQNVYDNPIVVCDVSGKNPNVMFELGMRLAFDKPTIVVKDDKTTYSFDTSAIEHLEYPRDLRFNTIVDFKEKLREKIKATYSKATSDPSYTTFLKHFGEFTIAKLDKKEVPSQQFVLEELKNIRLQLNTLQARSRPNITREESTPRFRIQRTDDGKVDLCLRGIGRCDKAIQRVLAHPQVLSVKLDDRGDHKHLIADVSHEFAAEHEREIARICRFIAAREDKETSN